MQLVNVSGHEGLLGRETKNTFTCHNGTPDKEQGQVALGKQQSKVDTSTGKRTPALEEGQGQRKKDNTG